MKKLALYLIGLPLFANSIQINEIVNKTYENNYELKSIEKAIKIANEDIKLSSKYKNPMLTIGANDIYFDEPFLRDNEAMQAQYIAFSQTIESNDKLKYKEKIQRVNKYIQNLYLEDKKLILKSTIHKKSWDILILKNKIKFLNDYKSNLKKLLDLSLLNYELGKNNQNDILNIKVKIANISMKINNIQNMIDNKLLDLENISYIKIDSLQDSLDIVDNDFTFNSNLHPKVKIYENKIEQLNSKQKLEDEKKFSDYKVNVAYFNRDDKFKDYANISLSIPLPIYNKENIEVLKAKLQQSKTEDELQNLKDSMNNSFKRLKNDMKYSLRNYKFIVKQIIPLKNSIQENIENYSSLNIQNLNMLISNLNELLDYEMKALDYKNQYFTAKANTIYYKANNEEGIK